MRDCGLRSCDPAHYAIMVYATVVLSSDSMLSIIQINRSSD
ncbi:UNVERIFIED_ORG: hypothetical protein QOE_3242 [Clostridioides difficile F501]